MKIYKSTDTLKTEKQWNNQGYILKPEAMGVDGWNNRRCTYRLKRYTTDEIIYNPAEANRLIISRENERKKRKGVI